MPHSEPLLLIAAALFGAIIGSFINALSFRFNTGRPFFKAMGGRSKCMHCGHALGLLDLVPVFSFIFLRAKCRYCGSAISWQYPLVELVAAVLSVGVYLTHAAPAQYALWFVVWMILLFTVVYDLRHSIIPWSCSIALAVLAFANLFITPGGALATPSLWALAAGPLLASPLVFTSLISRGTWMGWGDGALELSLGWFLGLSAGLSALMLSFWIGAAVGILLLAISRLGFFGYTIKSEMPFAPFLVLGAALPHFFHVDFFSMVSLF